MAFESRIARDTSVDTLCCPRPEQLAAQLARYTPPECRGLVSFGTCGGLDADLEPGQWIIADEVSAEGRRFLCDPEWVGALRAALPGAIGGAVAGSNVALGSPREKRKLGAQSGARAVDMESHIVGELAAHLEIPFAVCRVVIDPASRSLPLCALDAVGDDGETALVALLRALARRPGEFPGLMRLALDARAAHRALRHGRRQMETALLWPARRLAR